MACQIFDELKTATRLTPKDGEAATQYATRLARKASDISDDAWNTLTEPTQLWVNSALEAIERSRPIALPPGAEESMIAADAPKGKKKSAAKKPKAAEPKPKKAPVEDDESRIRDSAVITLLVKKNPHREGSIRDLSYKVLRDGMTVAQAVEAGARRQQIWSMVARKIISVA